MGLLAEVSQGGEACLLFPSGTWSTTAWLYGLQVRYSKKGTSHEGTMEQTIEMSCLARIFGNMLGGNRLCWSWDNQLALVGDDSISIMGPDNWIHDSNRNIIGNGTSSSLTYLKNISISQLPPQWSNNYEPLFGHNIRSPVELLPDSIKNGIITAMGAPAPSRPDDVESYISNVFGKFSSEACRELQGLPLSQNSDLRPRTATEGQIKSTKESKKNSSPSKKRSTGASPNVTKPIRTETSSREQVANLKIELSENEDLAIMIEPPVLEDPTPSKRRRGCMGPLGEEAGRRSKREAAMNALRLWRDELDDDPEERKKTKRVHPSSDSDASSMSAHQRESTTETDEEETRKKKGKRKVAQSKKAKIEEDHEIPTQSPKFDSIVSFPVKKCMSRVCSADEVEDQEFISNLQKQKPDSSNVPLSLGLLSWYPPKAQR